MNIENKSAKKTSSKKSSVGKKLAYLLTSMLGIVVIFLSVAYGAFYHYYGKMNITSDEDFEYVSKIDIQQGEDIDYSTMTDEERALIEYAKVSNIKN